MNNCPICFSKSVYYTSVVGNINFPKDKDVYELFKCNNCSHIFRTNLLDKNIYTEDYYAYGAATGNLSDMASKIFLNYNKSIFYRILWSLAQNFTRYQNTPYIENGKILDLGGGDGFVLNLYRKAGNETYNVEILDWVVEASKRNGHKTYKDLKEIDKDNYFDLIRVNQVFEHVFNPMEQIKDCYRLLKPGGKIYIGIPNIRSMSYLLFKDLFDQLSFPDHVHFFSESSIKILLKEFSNIKIIYPMHKYGVITNLYNIASRKLKLEGNSILILFSLILSIPANYLTKLIKKTHLIDIRAEKL